MNGTTDRRTFLAAAALAGVAAGTGPAGRAEAAPKKASRGLEYVDMIEGMVRGLLRESALDIGRAADICVEALTSGKKVYYTVRGHNEPVGIWERNRGKPSFLTASDKTLNVAGFNPGDVLITERTEWCAPSKERGVRLIGILMPFQPQKTRGREFIRPGYEGPWMEDICEVCIWDRAPFTVGTMSFDGIPFRGVPAHGAMDGITLGLILAASADRLIARGIEVEEAKPS